MIGHGTASSTAARMVPVSTARGDETGPDRLGGDAWRGFWRLADPKISLTSAASIYLGAAVAATEAPLAWGWLGLTVLVFFAMEVAKNAWGDVFDYDSGTDQLVAPEDRTEFSGGKRVLVDDLLDRRQTWAIAGATAAVGVGAGAVIVLFREFDALWIGLVGAGLGWSYHGPPLRLAYRGWGELDVALVYGPVIALTTYLIQRGALAPEVFWISLPLGVVIAAFLWVNEFPDVHADRQAGKRNLVVRLGKRAASRVLPVLYALVAGLLALLPALGLPVTVWWGGLFVLPAAYASTAVWRDPEAFHRRVPAQPAALLAFLLYSAGAGTGVLLA